MHGSVKDGWLVKRGKQVVKFWKHNGYAIPVMALHQVKGVVLHTEYDGILYQTSGKILSQGRPHYFGDELQYVLETAKWLKKD